MFGRMKDYIANIFGSILYVDDDYDDDETIIGHIHDTPVTATTINATNFKSSIDTIYDNSNVVINTDTTINI